MNLKAINNYVVAVMLEPKDTGGLAFADTVPRTMRWGKILTTGPGVVDFNGQLMPMFVEPDNIVYGMAHGLEDVDLSLLKEYDIDVPEGNIKAMSVNDIMVISKDPTTTEIQPLGQLIEIQKLKAPEKSEGGVFLIDNQKAPPGLSVVKTVGLGWKTPNNDDIPFHVKPGDIIFHHPYRAMVVDFEILGIPKKKYLITHADILGVLEVDDATREKLLKLVE